MEINGEERRLKVGDGIRNWADLPYVGLTGEMGLTGPSGNQGETGPSGNQGETGPTGPSLSIQGIGTTGTFLMNHPAGSNTIYSSGVIQQNGNEIWLGNPSWTSMSGSIGGVNGHRLVFDNTINGTAGEGVSANKIMLHNSTSGSGWIGGFGIEGNAVTYHSGASHTFYGGTTTAAYGTNIMSLSTLGTIIRGPGTYANLSSPGNILTSGLTIETTNGSARLKLGAYFTGGSGAGCAIQSSDFFSSKDNVIGLTLNPLGGNVGIGRIPGNRLDIQNAARTGTHPTGRPLYITGDINGGDNGVEVRHSNGTQGVGIGFNSVYAAGSNTNQDLNLIPRGTGSVVIMGNLSTTGTISGTISGTLSTSSTQQFFKLGLGGASSRAALDIYSSTQFALGPAFVWQNLSNNINFTAAATHAMSIYASNQIVGNTFLNPSDRRIKKNIQDISDGYALDCVRKIEPSYYEYINKAYNTSLPVVGFIAQQVREHFPNAINIVSEYIPNYYKLVDVSSNIGVSGELIFTLYDISSSFLNDLSEGQNIQLYDFKNMIYNCKILGFIDTDKIIVKSEITDIPTYDPENPNKLFLYGSQVSDFHILNKDYLFTLNFAATQELDRTVQQQAAEIDTLKQTIATQQLKIDELQVQLAAVMQHIGM